AGPTRAEGLFPRSRDRSARRARHRSGRGRHSLHHTAGASMRKVTFAATQFACSWDRKSNVAKAKALVREAAAKGANVILLQELFETPYFCQDQNPKHF